MAKKKIKDLRKEILSDDYEIEETDMDIISRLLLVKAIGRLATKP